MTSALSLAGPTYKVSCLAIFIVGDLCSAQGQGMVRETHGVHEGTQHVRYGGRAATQDAYIREIEPANEEVDRPSQSRQGEKGSLVCGVALLPGGVSGEV